MLLYICIFGGGTQTTLCVAFLSVVYTELNTAVAF